MLVLAEAGFEIPEDGVDLAKHPQVRELAGPDGSPLVGAADVGGAGETARPSETTLLRGQLHAAPRGDVASV